MFFLHTDMENNGENQQAARIENVVDDAIFVILQFLNWGAVLNFGATNVRHLSLVRRHIDRYQRLYGPIEFVLDQDSESIRNILQLFGDRLLHAIIHFQREFNMATFRNFVNGRTLLTNIQVLHLHLNVSVEDVYADIFRFYADVPYVFSQFETIYEQSMVDILQSINSNEMQHLEHLSFQFSFQLTHRTWRHHRNLEDHLNVNLNSLRFILSRGNVEKTLRMNSHRFVVNFIVHFNL